MHSYNIWIGYLTIKEKYVLKTFQNSLGPGQLCYNQIYTKHKTYESLAYVLLFTILT